MASLAPVFLIFLLGIILRRLNAFSRADADVLLRLSFYVAFPALALLSFRKLTLTGDLLYLPATAAVVFLSTLFTADCVARRRALPPKTRGTFVIGSAMMNMSLVQPFVLTMKGETGLAKSMLFDSANGLLIFTVGYFVACKYGDARTDTRQTIRKVVLCPPLWGIIAGCIMNGAQIPLPEFAERTFIVLGSMMVPTLMLSLGMFLSVARADLRLITTSIIIRMGGGLVIGTIAAFVFATDVESRAIVIGCSAAPAGFSTLAFASVTGLDEELAASIVSISAVLGMFVVPALIALFS